MKAFISCKLNTDFSYWIFTIK